MNTAPLAPATTHLSEDALDEILMDIAPPEALEHLRACPNCTQRLAAFQSSMAHFNQAALAWSESRSSRLSRDLLAYRPPFRLTPGNLRFAGATALLALFFGLHTALHRDAAGAAGADSAALASPTEIASDNELLGAIDSEITSPQPDRFGLAQTSTSGAETSPRALTRHPKD